ncbi:hypothetical protein L7F22_064510 [Adiantum nelumboides]|nr:hypothetical protein [Adiantum nelumboides]
MASLLHLSALPQLQISLLAIVALLSGLLLLWHRRSSSRHSQIKLPPGPPAWPFLGHLHLLGNDLPHIAFSKLSRVHGPLMTLRLGSVTVVVASSPEMAKEILQTHDQSFASRPLTAAGARLFFDWSDIAMAPYGPYWKLMRRLCGAHLFEGRRIEGSRGLREEEVRHLLRGVLKESRGAGSGSKQQLIGIRHHVKITTTDILSRLVMSQRLSTRGDILAVLEEFMHFIGAPNVGDLFPRLAWVDKLQGRVLQMDAVRDRIFATFSAVIEERRAERAAAAATPASKDLLDDLLDLSDNDKNEFGIPVSDQNITAVLMDMFAAGIDTSAFTVEWALAELLANPAFMKKARHELDLVVGKDRLVNDKDIPNLPYLQAIVKETLRLHPAGPLLAPHENMEACRIGDYYIPAKTSAFVNAWEIGRDPNVWENASKFFPDRFLDIKFEGPGQMFTYLPFGSGRRSCPGWQLGLSFTHLMLGSLLHSFDWKLPRSSKGKVDMTEKFKIALTLAHPLYVLATPRVPVYSLKK